VNDLIQPAQVLLPLLYLLTASLYGFLFFAGNPLARRAAPVALRVTLATHLLFLVALAVRWGQLPAVTVSQALSVVAFAVLAVYTIVEWRGRETATGFWMVSLAFLFQLLGSLLAREVPPHREIFHDPLFAAHVSLALLGYAAFAVAAGYGFLFLELYRELKAGRFSVFYGKLPPLEVLERMMTIALRVGFATLTGAVVTGGIWAHQMYPARWLGDPKILFTLLTWALYGVALLLRQLHHWQGRQTALASLVGLGAILFSLMAVNLFFTDFHAFL
jgi:ABC-type uncharacterized transport system permease subunit